MASNAERGEQQNADQLFEEWLVLSRLKTNFSNKDVNVPEPITKNDALVVIDMQKDFVPASTYNTDGGRFGVDEGEQIVAEICLMIKAASDVGATIIASRDYHPHDHCSFVHMGGHFPSHCVQGTAGSKFLPEIATALEQAMRQNGPDRVFVAFKGMHECTDSFAALPYTEKAEFPFGKERVAMTHEDLDQEVFSKFGAVMGCSQAPWTGSLVLKQSAILVVSDIDDHGRECETYDANAPPDVLAVLQDGHKRKLRTMQDVLRDSICPTKGRVFVCGLAMDYCVRDTCINAKALGMERVSIVLDASRAAHIPGVGAFGSGFLSDPDQVRASLQKHKVDIRYTTEVMPAGYPMPQKVVLQNLFPSSLGPLSIHPAPRLKIQVHRTHTALYSGGSYTLALNGPLTPFTLLENFSNEGFVSPLVALPQHWPRANTKTAASQLCWASPMKGIAGANFQTISNKFLAITVQPALSFAIYGGFLLLDDNDTVVEAQAIRGPRLGGLCLNLQEPSAWKVSFDLKALENAQRLQPTTIPSIRAKGADRFCWLGPHETFTSGNDIFMPSSTGGFLYTFNCNGKEPIYFPLSESQ